MIIFWEIFQDTVADLGKKHCHLLFLGQNSAKSLLVHFAPGKLRGRYQMNFSKEGKTEIINFWRSQFQNMDKF